MNTRSDTTETQRSRLTAALFVLLMAAGGCGSGSTSTDVDAHVDVDAQVDGDAEVDPDGGTPSPCVDPASLGDEAPPEAIRITRVEANPGVTIPLFVNGNEVTQPNRNARMPARRATLLRVYVETLAGWNLHTIEARVVLERPGGVSCTLVQTLSPSGSTTPGDLRSGFAILIPAEEVLPDTTYQVYLSDPSATPGPGTADTRVPETGVLNLGVEDSRQHMRMVIVPVNYSYGNCARFADTSAAHMQAFYDAMFQQYPLESLDLTVRAPLSWTDPLEVPADLSALLAAVLNMRETDAPDEDVYYYGLFDNCDLCLDVTGQGDCLRGLAIGEGGFPPSGRTRNAIGQAGERELWTFVHETGHMHGRNHVDCPGPDPGNTDANYPYADGSIGDFGYGILDGLLRDPATDVDFMTICVRPTWVSDYNWEAYFERIASLNPP
jgi:hypothetical protein